jgi:hypothetical protein
MLGRKVLRVVNIHDVMHNLLRLFFNGQVLLMVMKWAEGLP